MSTGWKHTAGSMDGKLQDLKFCRAAAPIGRLLPRCTDSGVLMSDLSLTRMLQARAIYFALLGQHTAIFVTIASRALTTTAPGETPVATSISRSPSSCDTQRAADEHRAPGWGPALANATTGNFASLYFQRPSSSYTALSYPFGW